jgi:hypothetical protein
MTDITSYEHKTHREKTAAEKKHSVDIVDFAHNNPEAKLFPDIAFHAKQIIQDWRIVSSNTRLCGYSDVEVGKDYAEQVHQEIVHEVRQRIKSLDGDEKADERKYKIIAKRSGRKTDYVKTRAVRIRNLSASA